jgi:phage terminase large subunit-like protein
MVTAGAARRQPLLLVITTEGDTNSKLWINERNYCYGVLQDLYQDETLFAMLYAIDEKDQWDDPAVWVKANPNLGVSVKPEYLSEFCNAARHNSEKRNQFLRYHCNRVVSATEWGIDLQAWNALASPLSDWKEAEVITVGFDLGGWDDLAGVAYCARFVDGTEIGEDGSERTSYRYEFKTQAYLYTTGKRDVSKLPWVDWCHSGLVRREEFVIAAIKRQILADHETFGFESIAYDQFNAQQLGEELTSAGIKAVSFRQNFLMYNEPLHNFLSLIERQKIRHDGNAMLSWCAGNLAIKRDSADRWMPCKKSSKDKIDPLVACLMAFRLAMLSPPKPKGNLFVY